MASVWVPRLLHTQLTVMRMLFLVVSRLLPSSATPTRHTRAPCHASCDTQTQTMVWTLYSGITKKNMKDTGLAAHPVLYILKCKRLIFPGSQLGLTKHRWQGGQCHTGPRAWIRCQNRVESRLQQEHRCTTPALDLTSVPQFPCLQSGENESWLL